MKTKKLKQLLHENTTICTTDRKVSVNVLNEFCEVTGFFKSEDNFDLEVDGLTEFQENIVIHYLKDVWEDNFSNGWCSYVTQEDRLNAIELIYK